MAFSAFERFTIVDTDGELLASPGDELDIIEPTGFGEFINNIKADEEYFGFNAEFGEGESELSFDWNKAVGAVYSGQEFVTWFVDNIGIDANISLRYYRTSGGIETLEYEWALILKSADEADAPISVRVKKEDFSDKLRTRFDTDIDVESDVDLDNNTNVALDLIELPLYSRGTKFESDFESENEVTVAATTDLKLQRICTLPFSVTNLSEIQGLSPQPGIWSAPTTDTQIPEEFTASINPLYYMFEVIDAGVYNFDINILGYDIELNNSDSGNADWTVNLIFKIFDADDNLIDYTILDSSSGSSDPAPQTYSGSGSYLQSHTLSEGDKIYLYVRVFCDVLGSSPAEQYWNLDVDTGSYFRADVITYKLPSTTTGHFVYDVLDRAIQKAIGMNSPVGTSLTEINTTGLGSGGWIVGETMTGSTSGATAEVVSKALLGRVTVNNASSTLFVVGETVTGGTSGESRTIQTLTYSTYNTIIQSDLIEKTEQGAATDGYASLNFITTGKKIRGLTDNANLKVKPSQLFDFIRCRWAAGWQIVNDSGTKHIKVDKNWEFMEPVKILTLYNVENPVRRSFNQDIIYNESEVGYTKFAKENEDGSIDGFNTKQDRLHPIEKEKKKFSLIAPATTDGAEIERIRRLKIRDDESDQSDDEIIIIKCQRISQATQLQSSDVGNFASIGGVNFFGIEFDAATDSITLNGLYLKGQADNATQITTTVAAGALGVSGTNTWDIDSITFDSVNNKTVIIVTQNLVNTVGYFDYTLYFDIDVFIPERNASFLSISGITDQYSEYNIDQAPSNFLIQWWHILGGAVTQKASTKIVKFMNGKNTVSLSKRYQTTDGNLTTSQITEGQDFTLNSLNTYNPPIITPFAYDVICYLTYDDWQLIRRALLGENTDSPSKNWGYLEFTDNFGNLVQIWPRALKRTEKSGKVEIYGWQRNTATPPPPATFFILQENGDYLLQENDDRTLQEV